MDPSWYSHALPRDRSPAGRGREQCLEHVGGVLSRPVAVVVRLVRAVPVCSRWAARNPWCLTKSINSNAIKKKGKKLKVFLCQRRCTGAGCSNSACHGEFSKPSSLASTAPASLPLAKMDVLRRNQHNSCPGKAGLASHCTNALSSLLFLFSESREMESWHCGIKSNSQEAG